MVSKVEAQAASRNAAKAAVRLVPVLPMHATRGLPAPVLTPPRPEDSDVLFGWINDPDLVRFNAPFRPVPRAEHDAWFASLNSRDDKWLFVIRPHVDGPAVGSVQLIDINALHGSAELTIRIGDAAHRERGLGGAALDAVCRHGFGPMGLHRIWLRVFTTNLRAIRAYEGGGFEKEGVMRQSCFMDGVWLDQLVMARLSPAS